MASNILSVLDCTFQSVSRLLNTSRTLESCCVNQHLKQNITCYFRSFSAVCNWPSIIVVHKSYVLRNISESIVLPTETNI